MEPKGNLNNTQRKMLDEIYTEQFRTKEKIILSNRENGLKELIDKTINKERASKNIKVTLATGKKYFELLKAHKQEISDKGLKITSKMDYEPELEISSGYYNDYKMHPDLVKYNEETNLIKIELAQKKKEIRARIYGLATTYQEADKEISEVLKGIEV